MSLDTFMGKEKVKTPASSSPIALTLPKILRQRFDLVCPNPKCKYSRVVVKGKLGLDDLVCPKCGKELRAKKSSKKKDASDEDME